MKKNKHRHNRRPQNTRKPNRMNSRHQEGAEAMIMERAMREMSESVGPTVDQLMEARANAELMCTYMSRVIERIDAVLDVIDEYDWSFDADEEDDEC